MEPMEWVVIAVILIVVFLFFKNAMTTHTAASIQTQNAVGITKSGTCSGDCFKGGTTIAAGVTEPNLPPTAPPVTNAGLVGDESNGAVYKQSGANGLTLTYLTAYPPGTSIKNVVWWPHWNITQFNLIGGPTPSTMKCGIPITAAFPVNPLPTPIAIQTGATCRLQFRQQEPTSTVPKAIRL